jgi:gamma-glutamyl phosphate reductase
MGEFFHNNGITMAAETARSGLDNIPAAGVLISHSSAPSVRKRLGTGCNIGISQKHTQSGLAVF